jgi:hypothetical protein
MSDAGRYSGVIEAFTRVALGHQISIRFGDALVDVVVGFAEAASCRFDIDAEAVRIWPT